MAQDSRNIDLKFVQDSGRRPRDARLRTVLAATIRFRMKHARGASG